MAARKSNRSSVSEWLLWHDNIEPFRGENFAVVRTPLSGTHASPPQISIQPAPSVTQSKTVSSLHTLDEIAEAVSHCSLCPLSSGRTLAVPGEGAANARLMFIGEGPGRDEDVSGKPFVGKAGQLLTKIIEAGLGISRSDCYIANIVKCRPPHNRNPFDNEAAACILYLHRQIELIKPEMIVLFGRVALKHLLGIESSLREARSRLHHFRNIPVVVTYHPAALLRNPSLKRAVWDDLQTVIKHLDLPGATR